VHFHLVRQPIFNKAQSVYAYDLLLRRAGVPSGPGVGDGDHPQLPPKRELNRASMEVIAHSSLLTDLKEIANGRRVLINVTQDVLEGDYVYALPKKTAVVALDGAIKPGETSVAACRKLRNAGYQLVLDGMGGDEGRAAFLKFVNFVKVDLSALNSGGAAAERGARELTFFRQAAAKLVGLQMIGSGVRDRELARRAQEAGCTLFAGDFFSRPETVTGRDIQAFKLPFLQLLKEIHQPEMDFSGLEKIIRQDTALTYKLLRYVNSAALNRREEIRTIQSALGILGEREIKKWATMVGVSGLVQGKPKELLAKALARARFCQDLAPHVRMERSADELFLVGMCSLLDVILERPLAEVLDELPLGELVKGALLGESNPYRSVYDCMIAYEQGLWNEVADQAMTLSIDETKLPALYVSTISWVNQQMGSEALYA
jgi:EAL and modified HD-GYP domain-containing signal transduction protein